MKRCGSGSMPLPKNICAIVAKKPDGAVNESERIVAKGCGPVAWIAGSGIGLSRRAIKRRCDAVQKLRFPEVAFAPF